ncbi:MAG: Uma2 family endonuclease [Planctomycetota bacterium]|jgi:Uma2 family endonuclease
MEALFTRADYERLPEGFPAQLVEGLLCREPAPRYAHQRTGARIRRRMLALVDADLVPDSPVDVALDEHNVFQPDLVVLRERPPPDAQYVGIPLLALEVLSPATGERDRTVKKDHLLEAGVAEVWIVDPGAASIEIHTKAGVTGHARTDVAASTVVPGFHLVPALLFAD